MCESIARLVRGTMFQWGVSGALVLALFCVNLAEGATKEVVRSPSGASDVTRMISEELTPTYIKSKKEKSPVAQCSWSIANSVESACSQCKKGIKGAKCGDAVGGCNDEGQFGGLAVGINNSVPVAAVGGNYKNGDVAQAAWRALKNCNGTPYAREYGLSCKLVRTWGQGCNYGVTCCN